MAVPISPREYPKIVRKIFGVIIDKACLFFVYGATMLLRSDAEQKETRCCDSGGTSRKHERLLKLDSLGDNQEIFTLLFKVEPCCEARVPDLTFIFILNPSKLVPVPLIL